MGSLLFAQLRYPACMHLVVGTILVASHRLGHDTVCPSQYIAGRLPHRLQSSCTKREQLPRCKENTGDRRTAEHKRHFVPNPTLGDVQTKGETVSQ